MRRLIILLLIFAASVCLGLWVLKHPGMVTIVMQPWMVEAPLWFVLASFLIFLFLFYFLIDCIDQVQFLWFRFKNWLRFRREHKLYNKTQHGLTLLIEGRFKKAERLLLTGRNQSFDPLMNYLGAARAACELKADDRVQIYLQKAREVAPHAELAIGLTQAELEYAHEQPKKAAKTLEKLRLLSPRHPRVLALLEKVYVRLAEWQLLLQLLPSLRKAKVLNAAQQLQFEKNVYCEILQHANQKSLTDLQGIWANIPRYMRKNPEVVYAYVQQILRFSEFREIEELTRYVLKSHWHPQLVALYGTLPFVNLNRQLVVAGAWIKMYGDRQPLLLTLGRLCARIQLFGKAKEYYERSLALGVDRETLLAYGQLLEELGEKDAAMVKYKAAISAK